MNIRARQIGLTMISWIILVGMIGFIGIFGFKLMPIYMNFYTIDSALKTTTKNVTEGESVAQIRSGIDNLFNVNSINVIKGKDVNIAPDPDNPKALVMTLDYEERTNFVANVDLIVHFAKTYPVNLH